MYLKSLFFFIYIYKGQTKYFCLQNGEQGSLVKCNNFNRVQMAENLVIQFYSKLQTNPGIVITIYTMF